MWVNQIAPKYTSFFATQIDLQFVAQASPISSGWMVVVLVKMIIVLPDISIIAAKRQLYEVRKDILEMFITYYLRWHLNWQRETP